MSKLPTTTRDYRINYVEGGISVDDVSMTVEQALCEFPEDAEYIAWFVRTYN